MIGFSQGVKLFNYNTLFTINLIYKFCMMNEYEIYKHENNFYDY